MCLRLIATIVFKISFATSAKSWLVRSFQDSCALNILNSQLSWIQRSSGASVELGIGWAFGVFALLQITKDGMFNLPQ
jgi:hypothetical protein